MARQPLSDTLAMGADPSQRLLLGKNFQPDVDLLLAEGLNAFGVPGSGKSNLVSLLCEQLGRFSLPQLIVDTEGEYRRLINALPHGIVATANRCPSGYDILNKGLQVVLDLSTWHSEEAAALALVQLMNELFKVAGEQLAAGEAVPCPIHLDEAGYWLPQGQVDYLSKDTRKALYTVFQRLVNRGRKAGLVPFIYTQFISQINKDVIRRGGVLVLMRQTLDVDLRRYGEFIPDFDDERKESVRAFPTGKAAVVLPDGNCPLVRFYRCQTEHATATPRARAAVVKFSSVAVDVRSINMVDRSGQVDEHAPVQRAQTTAPASKSKLHKSKSAARAKTAPTIKQRVFALLRKNQDMTGGDLAALLGCSRSTAVQHRREFLKKHAPSRLLHRGRDPQGGSVVEARIRALLAENPNYTVADLAPRARCAYSDAKRWLARIQQPAQ
jgi:hypothetical protein